MVLLKHIATSILLVVTLCVSAAENSRTDTIALNELVVTALKQSNRLDDLPLAASIVTAAETDRLNIATVRGISDVVPNFFVPEYGSRITSSIYVRGIGARMDQPSVGLNVDGVGFLNKDAYDFDIADIVSVEMLRGPQSTLYGRNTMAGQINISTLSPFEYQGLRVMAQAGNGFDGKINLGYYHLVNDDFGVSVSAGYNHSNGWFKNLYNGKNTDIERLISGRIKMNYRPDNQLSMQNVLAASGLRQGGYPYESVESGRIEYSDTCFYRRFCLNDGLTVRYVTDFDVMLSSITSVQYIDDNMTLDQDFLPLSYFTLTQKKRETAVTQDFIARRTGDHAYKWTAGLYGFYKHLHMLAPVTFLDYGISQLIENHRNDAIPSFPIKWDTREFPLNSDFVLPTWGVSLYHESAFESGNWSLTAGLRFDYEHVSMDYRSWCNTGYNIYKVSDGHEELFRHVPIDIDDKGALSDSFIELLPKIGVVYKLDDDINFYASVSKGYKAGGYNTQMFSDILQQRIMGIMGIGASYDVEEVVSYRPEKSWNYEVGAHIKAFDGKFSSEISLFYIDCRDQQLTMFPNGSTTGRIMTNAGKTRSFGGELQASLRNVGLFSFNASYGYTNARFVSFFNGISEFRGKRIPYAPENTLFAQVVCDIPFKDSWFDSLQLDANVRAAGKIYWNESNSLSQPMYALVGASATLTKGEWSLQLWGENLTSTKYNTFYFMSIGNEFLQRGRPLHFGVTLRLNFNK